MFFVFNRYSYTATLSTPRVSADSPPPRDQTRYWDVLRQHFLLQEPSHISTYPTVPAIQKKAKSLPVVCAAGCLRVWGASRSLQSYDTGTRILLLVATSSVPQGGRPDNLNRKSD